MASTDQNFRNAQPADTNQVGEHTFMNSKLCNVLTSIVMMIFASIYGASFVTESLGVAVVFGTTAALVVFLMGAILSRLTR